MMNSEARQELMDKIRNLKVPGLLDAYTAQTEREPELIHLPFEERMSLLIDALWETRTNNRTARLAKQTHFAIPSARLEILDSENGTRFDERVLNELKGGGYISSGFNAIITGAAGSSKTFVSNALGMRACEEGFTVRYYTFPQLLEERATASVEHTESVLRENVCKPDLLILDEFLLTDPTSDDLLFLFAIMSARTGKRSTIFCTHYRFPGWHDRLGGGPLVESLLDRIRPLSYELALTTSVSMREKYNPRPITNFAKTN